MNDLGIRARPAEGRRPRRPWLLFLVAAGLLWCGYGWWQGRRYRLAMAEIEAEILNARFATASRDLDELLTWAPDRDGKAAFLLGNCELALGRIRAADDAWARVPAGSEYSVQSILKQMLLLEGRGRLADAERFILDAAGDHRNDGTALLMALMPLYRLEGRDDEARRLIERQWEREDARGEGASASAIELVRLHVDLTRDSAPVEAIRDELDRAARLAPQDDRVWLGRANLAIRTGDHDEAGRWLDRCERSRPEDVAVQHARLGWGIATGRVAVVERAIAHRPAAGRDPAEVHRARAWLAARRGAVAAERRELERLAAIDPADRAALDRLARLAEEDGRPDRAAALRRQQAAIDRLHARFERLHARWQPVRDAAELAHLAAELGRDFEARAFLTVAISEDPDREDLRREFERLGSRPTKAAARAAGADRGGDRRGAGPSGMPILAADIDFAAVSKGAEKGAVLHQEERRNPQPGRRPLVLPPNLRARHRPRSDDHESAPALAFRIPRVSPPLTIPGAASRILQDTSRSAPGRPEEPTISCRSTNITATPCEHTFEALIRGSGDAARCPKCGSVEVAKQFSVPAAAARTGRGPADLPIAGGALSFGRGRPQYAGGTCAGLD